MGRLGLSFGLLVIVTPSLQALIQISWMGTSVVFQHLQSAIFKKCSLENLPATRPLSYKRIGEKIYLVHVVQNVFVGS